MAATLTLEQAMSHAVVLARRGTGYVSPNPRVGCVLLHHGTIIGEGWHQHYGGPHSEVEALRSCANLPPDATLVVTLEPCSHTGKTPPCADAIIAAGIRHVVVGCVDPNPLVAGRGIERLRSSGIRVDVGVGNDDCVELIRGFSTFITTSRPYVALKLAQSLDGSIMSSTRRSSWITSLASRQHVHALRAEFDAILVGVGTVIADNPLLSVRHVDLPSPRRFVLDPHLRTPIDSQLVQTANTIPTTILTHPDRVAEADSLRSYGVRVSATPIHEEKVNIASLLTLLHSENVTSLLLEGGAATASAFLEADAVDTLHLHVAPMLLGNSPRWFNVNVDDPASAPRWQTARVRLVDSDVHLTYHRKQRSNDVPD